MKCSYSFVNPQKIIKHYFVCLKKHFINRKLYKHLYKNVIFKATGQYTFVRKCCRNDYDFMGKNYFGFFWWEGRRDGKGDMRLTFKTDMTVTYVQDMTSSITQQVFLPLLSLITKIFKISQFVQPLNPKTKMEYTSGKATSSSLGILVCFYITET